MSQSFFSIHANATFCNSCNIEFATLSNFSRHQREIHDRGSSQYNDVSENDNQHSVEELVDNDAYFDSYDKDDADNVQYLSDENDESAFESNDEEVEGFNTYQSTSVWSSNPYYPFKNEMEMKVLMFFKGSQDRFSNRIIKKTMHLMRQLVLISHQERDLIQQRPEGFDPLRNVPKDDRICKSHNTKRKFPRLEVDKAVIPKENGQSVDLFMIKPSNHLRLIMANTQKVKLLKSLPDFTPNQRYRPNQGRKWKENCHLQTPMVTKEIANTSNDFWIGDVVRTSGDQQQMYTIVSFFTVDSQIFISGFPMEFFENFQAAAFGSEKVNVPVSNIALCMSITELRDQCQQQLSSKLIRSDGEICYTPFNQLLTPHYNLIAESLAIRERVPHIAPNRQMTVRVVPISLFSDDTSGNTTKKWNCYDSWIMTPAALPLKDRNMYENQFFLCTYHNLNAMDTASRLVEDLKSLEDGMVMYDLEYDEEVLVYAPVLFITGDNIRHSEICCSKGSKSTCPCRKCFWQLDPPQPKNRPVTPVRTRLQDYVAAPRFKMYSVMYAIDELP